MTFFAAANATLAAFMEITLKAVKCGIPAAFSHQFIVGSHFDQASVIKRQNTIGKSNRGKPMGNDEHRAARRHLRHVPLYDPLAFTLVERTC